MTLRKYTALLVSLVLVFALTLTACETSNPNGSPSVTTAAEPAEPTDSPPAITCQFTGEELEPYILPKPSGEPPEEVEFPGYEPLEHELRDITPWELKEEITVGWNLGNTFDAPTAETSWGNPRTTYTLMSVIKDAGFDSVRLPVSWGVHQGAAPDFTITDERLDRVQEVVDYILALGMYCILNTHHESWLLLDPENEEATTERLIATWEQLSERFADYNEKLIFEGMNEPRTIGSDMEWEGGTFEEWNTINRLNQAFVDTVRASVPASNGEERNKLRHLLVPTYAASANREPIEALSLNFPKDESNKTIASIHAYVPHNFALRTIGNPNWSIQNSVNTNDVDWMFGRLRDYFINNDIPVILGETGAVDRRGNLQSRVEWTEYFFGKARELGIPCYWWDNGLFYRDPPGEREHFGLLNRHLNGFVFPEIIDAMMGR
jgi:endoglucanase